MYPYYARTFWQLSAMANVGDASTTIDSHGAPEAVTTGAMLLDRMLSTMMEVVSSAT